MSITVLGNDRAYGEMVAVTAKNNYAEPSPEVAETLRKTFSCCEEEQTV